jgi:tetratricopeptide (TPR) repeat protein
MERAFLSYRRADSDYALLLYEYLKQGFGRKRVFLDVDFIEPGQDFTKILQTELGTCAAFIALIGRGWLESLSRLHEPDDYVRFEIASVLQRGILLVPILAGGTRMPKPGQFPDELAELSHLSALEIRVDSDLQTLQRVLRKALPEAAPTPAIHDPAHHRVLELLKRQVQRSQVRAVELIEQGRSDRAFDELQETIEVILCLQQWGPPDVALDLHLGYVYKTLAQAYQTAAKDMGRAEEYFDLAASVFERAEAAGAYERYTTAERAGAINGLGNIYYQRGDLDRAIERYRVAIGLAPEYAYAWHDLFGALVARAQRGEVDLPALREAYERMKRTGQGQPGLSAQYLAQLEAWVQRFEEPAAGPPARKRRRRNK